MILINLKLSKIQIVTMLAILSWAVMHGIYIDHFLYHDSWRHIFPVVYRIAKDGSCGQLPQWIGSIDNGSPTAIYSLSMSLFNPIRVVAILIFLSKRRY